MNAHINTTTAPVNAKPVKIGSPSLPGAAFESAYQKQAAPRRAAMRAVIDAAASASYSLVQAAKAHLVAYTDRDMLAEPASGSAEHPIWEAEAQRLDEIEGEAWLEFLGHPCFGSPDQNLKAAYIGARPGGMNNLIDEAADVLIASMRAVGGQDVAGVTVGSMVYARPTSGFDRSAEGLCIVKEVFGDVLTDHTISGDVSTFRRDMISHWLEGVVVEGGHKGRVVSNPTDDSQMLELAARFDALRPVQKAAWEGIARGRAEAQTAFEAKHGEEPDYATDPELCQSWRERFQASPAYRRWHNEEERYSETIGTPTYMLAAAIEMTKPNTLAGFAAKARVRVYMSELSGIDGADDHDHNVLVEIAEEAAALMSVSAASPIDGDDGEPPILPDLDLSEFSIAQLIHLSKSAGELGNSCNEFSERYFFKVTFETGPYKGSWEHTANGKIAASITEWADNQSDRAKDEIAARQPQSAAEAYARCVAMAEREGKNEESLESIMAIVAEGIALERALSKKAA